MARASDYGGHAHERDDPAVAKITARTHRSYHCNTCGKLFFITHLAANRVSRVACLICGGTGVETEPSERRRLQRRTRKQEEEGRTITDKSKPFECYHCERRFRSMAAMRIHARESHATLKIDVLPPDGAKCDLCGEEATTVVVGMKYVCAEHALKKYWDEHARVKE